ncbi:integrase core domain-containing protein, partial [Portibacter marinus]|uniref:integrase core domain-containing protein n=1 Tax=Portibacter marinus TaxID=2898660 RepID=UPI001F18AF7A
TEQVKQVWEYILANYIQPIRGKSAEVEIEVRSDNGKQFSSKDIMTFFEENELTKVFTHPYTPEENGHIESFHSKLGKALKNDRFASLQALENRLTHFYTMYNNKRSHGSLKGLPPAIFWALDDLGYVDVITDQEKRTNKILLNVAYQEILGLPKVNKYKYRALRA